MSPKCRTGYANHGDYLFGWQDDSLQRAMDSPCYQNCPTLKSQNAAAMNQCTIKPKVNEDIDSCESNFRFPLLPLLRPAPRLVVI